MQKRRLVMGVAICLVLAACKKEADPIVGKWHEMGGKGRAEYLADGSAIVYDGSTPMPLSGTWKRLEDGRLKIEATVMGTNTAAVYQVAFEGDTATFTNSEGDTETYQRARLPAGEQAENSASGQAEAPPERRLGRDEEAQKRTVMDVRTIGTAMFSWLTDQVGAAAAGQTQIEDTSRGVHIEKYTRISREDLEKILVPQYLEAIPQRDGWGHPYEFYLNVKNTMAQQVMGIRSPGRDGRFSSNDYALGSFDPARLDEDIVWTDGFFVRWPAAPSR